MFRIMCLAFLVVSSSPAVADCDEMSPVPAQALIGHTYMGDNRPSAIRFIDVRNRPVRITWVAFDGVERPYLQMSEGDEIIQPTFVAHRWLVRDAADGTPLEGFISTCSATRNDGSTQIALIR
jgi:hypothetical protein